MSNEAKDAKDVMDKIMDMVDKEALQEDPSTAAPLILSILHSVAHVALAARIELHDFVAAAVKEFQEAQKCVAASYMQEILEQGLRARAETIPDDQKN